MSVFNVPSEVKLVVQKRFRNRDRRLIAHELLTMDHYPSTEDRVEMAEKYGTDTDTVRRVTYALQDLSLFTEKQGSMPLYEHILRIEQEAKKLVVLSDPRIDTGKTDLGDNKHDTEENQDPGETDEGDTEDNAKTVEEKQPLSVKDDLDRLKVQFGGLNTRVQGVETLLGDIDTKINLLVGQKTPPNTSDPTANTQTPAQNATATPTTTMATSEKPYANLSREDAIDLLLNRPVIIKEEGNPNTQLIQAQPSMIRKMIIEVTTYTQMLYERALADGAFEGSFSDFLNWAPDMYFADRNWSLGWHRYEPARR